MSPPDWAHLTDCPHLRKQLGVRRYFRSSPCISCMIFCKNSIFRCSCRDWFWKTLWTFVLSIIFSIITKAILSNGLYHGQKQLEIHPDSPIVESRDIRMRWAGMTKLLRIWWCCCLKLQSSFLDSHSRIPRPTRTVSITFVLGLHWWRWSDGRRTQHGCPLRVPRMPLTWKK